MAEVDIHHRPYNIVLALAHLLETPYIYLYVNSQLNKMHVSTENKEGILIYLIQMGESGA